MSRRIRVFASLSLVLVGLLLFSSVAAAAGGGQGNVPLERARQVLEERLIDVPGIAGIAHSEESGEIVVFLENENARGKSPAWFDGYPVRREVVGNIRALSAPVAEPVALEASDLVTPQSPMVGGLSLSAYVPDQYWAGTLGMVTYDNKLLTNAHVIALDLRNKWLPTGSTPVVQPGTLDGGTVDHCQVGELANYIPISFNPRVRNQADAAIATFEPVNPLIEASFGEQIGGYRILDYRDAREDEQVKKSGRTTGVTSGTVEVTNATVVVDYGYGKKAYFEDQIVVLPGTFIAAGDSGSAVATMDNKFLGLAFAGSSTHAIVCKAHYIIEGLGVALSPITSPTLKSITVDPNSASIAVGGTQQFKAIGLYDDGTERILTSEAVWNSDAPTVAKVSKTGLATGISVGSANVTAAIGALSDTASVTVTPEGPPTLIVELTGLEASYSIGQTVNITATVTDGAGPVDAASVTTEVVTGKGKLVFLGAGTTNEHGEVTFSFTIERRDGPGTYKVNAVASAGDASGSGSATFNVSK